MADGQRNSRTRIDFAAGLLVLIVVGGPSVFSGLSGRATGSSPIGCGGMPVEEFDVPHGIQVSPAA